MPRLESLGIFEVTSIRWTTWHDIIICITKLSSWCYKLWTFLMGKMDILFNIAMDKNLVYWIRHVPSLIVYLLRLLFQLDHQFYEKQKVASDAWGWPHTCGNWTIFHICGAHFHVNMRIHTSEISNIISSFRLTFSIIDKKVSWFSAKGVFFI